MTAWLISFLKGTEPTAWLSGSLHTGRSRWKQLGADELPGFQRVYVFPAVDAQIAVLVGVKEAEDAPSEVWRAVTIGLGNCYLSTQQAQLQEEQVQLGNARLALISQLGQDFQYTPGNISQYQAALDCLNGMYSGVHLVISILGSEDLILSAGELSARMVAATVPVQDGQKLIGSLELRVFSSRDFSLQDQQLITILGILFASKVSSLLQYPAASQNEI